jgi:putative transcriptional regulator
VKVGRAIAGLTQAELAQAVGSSRQTIVTLEAGGYAPSVYLALRIARALSASVEDLFTADADPTANGDHRAPVTNSEGRNNGPAD